MLVDVESLKALLHPLADKAINTHQIKRPRGYPAGPREQELLLT
jgi:hypothetical protein